MVRSFDRAVEENDWSKLSPVASRTLGQSTCETRRPTSRSDCWGLTTALSPRRSTKCFSAHWTTSEKNCRLVIICVGCQSQRKSILRNLRDMKDCARTGSGLARWWNFGISHFHFIMAAVTSSHYDCQPPRNLLDQPVGPIVGETGGQQIDSVCRGAVDCPFPQVGSAVRRAHKQWQDVSRISHRSHNALVHAVTPHTQPRSKLQMLAQHGARPTYLWDTIHA